MAKRVLVTGGAGFIGLYVCEALLAANYKVRILDNLHPQVHGGGRKKSGRLVELINRSVEFRESDVCVPQTYLRALHGVDAVIHLAAEVGVGQSMYNIGRYTFVNDYGTAVLLDALIKQPVERIVVASSMSIYGEGQYRAQNGITVLADGFERNKKSWDPLGLIT